MKIAEIHGYEVYDSRGLPTIACNLVLDNGMYVTSMVPSGASTGKHEALELRDGGERLFGKGVKKAIENIHEKIAPALINKELDAIEMDRIIINLDPTIQKKVLGANATLAVSMALFRAHAMILSMEVYDFIAQTLRFDEISIPVPLINVINGGSHADNNLSIQEYLIIPFGVSSFAQAMEVSSEIVQRLGLLLKQAGKNTYTGDEGGFAPSFSSSIEPLDFIVQAIHDAGYDSSTVGLGLDVAASEFYDEEKEKYLFDGELYTSEKLIDFYSALIKKYPLLYIEDGLAQDDWKYWKVFKDSCGEFVRIIGDDLLVTNHERIKYAIEEDAVGGAIIKPNQIGTVSEALQAVLLCQENGLTTVASHRSGETSDFFIADFALGVNAQYIKCGGLHHSDRLAKYNRFLQIEYLKQVSLF